MLNDEICKLREELNKSINTGKDYKRIYEISIELDQLIAQYYKKEIEIRKKSKKNNKKSKKVKILIW